MKSAFVIMPFGKTLEEKLHWKGVYMHLIKPILQELEYDVIRADEIGHQGNITSNIIRLLWSSDLVIADLTTNNPNVFYELGIRHALRKHGTILLAQKGEKLPFDIANYHVSFYDTSVIFADQIKTDLRKRIEASQNFTSSDNPVFDFLKEELEGLDERYRKVENELIELRRGISLTLRRLVASQEENLRIHVAGNLIELFTAIGGLVEKLSGIRFKLAMESNIILPAIRIVDDYGLEDDVFVVYLDDQMILTESIDPDFCYVTGDMKEFENLVTSVTKLPFSNEYYYRIQKSKAHLVENLRNRIIFPVDLLEHDLLLAFKTYINNLDEVTKANIRKSYSTPKSNHGNTESINEEE